MEPYVIRKPLADPPKLDGKRGREHHNLLVPRGCRKDLMDMLSHVRALEHFLTLVKNEIHDMADDQKLLFDEIQDTAGGPNHNMWFVNHQDLLLLLHPKIAGEVGHLNANKVFA